MFSSSDPTKRICQAGVKGKKSDHESSYSPGNICINKNVKQANGDQKPNHKIVKMMKGYGKMFFYLKIKPKA